MGVNHVRLVMNQNCEVFVYGSPRGRPSGSSETCTKLKYGKEMQKQLKKIKKKMHLKSNTEILLALSVATDEMIRHVSMFPETWYFDVTENTNSEKGAFSLVLYRIQIRKHSSEMPLSFRVVRDGSSRRFTKDSSCIYWEK